VATQAHACICSEADQGKKFSSLCSLSFAILNPLQHREIVRECLRVPGVYLVTCQIKVDSEISVHAIAIDSSRGELSDSLMAHVQKFDVDSMWWKANRILNVIHVYQVMTQAQE
jgi:hypothetical protein